MPWKELEVVIIPVLLYTKYRKDVERCVVTDVRVSPPVVDIDCSSFVLSIYVP